MMMVLTAVYAEEADEKAFDEKDVVDLGTDNFSEVVKGNKFVLVEFYAPWCGHCKSLAPEYAKAATIVKKDGIVLAKLDATENKELGEEYGIRGFPTMIFFKNGQPKPYSGGRTAEDIVSWVQKKSGPAVQTVKTDADAEKVWVSGNPVAMAFVESLEDEHAKAFEAMADAEEGVTFCITDDKKIATKFGLGEKSPALVLLKKEAEKVTHFEEKAFSQENLSNFIKSNKLPLVITFSRETASDIFSSDINKQFLLFASPEEYKKLKSAYEAVAKSFKGQIIFVLVNQADTETAAPVLEFFSLPGDKTVLMGFLPESNGLKFVYEGDFSRNSLKEFGEKFVADKLEPYFKSEEVPETNDEAVKVVVGKSFESIVLDDSKDVLLEVYAPWCGHCQTLEPEYNKLAELLKDVKSLVVAKMDGTKNEHGRIKIEGFPTVLFFPAGKKSEEPISAGNYRTAAGLGKFLKENAAIPFKADLPEYVELKAGEGAPEDEAPVDYNEQLQQADEATEAKDEL
jgi:protein disulfide-isomerase A1